MPTVATNAVTTLVNATMNPAAIAPQQSAPPPMTAPPAATTSPMLGTLVIPHFAAMAIVGNHAARNRRFGPTRMSKSCTTSEVLAVQELMGPFVESEAHRLRTNRYARVTSYSPMANANQCRALKKMLLQYGRYLEVHLAKKGHDKRYFNSQKRLNQVCDVIGQINALLGLPPDDGRSLESYIGASLWELAQAAAGISELEERVLAANVPANQLTQLRPMLTALAAVRQAITNLVDQHRPTLRT